MKYLIIFFIFFSKPVFSQVFSINEIVSAFNSDFPNDFIILCKTKGFVVDAIGDSISKKLYNDKSAPGIFKTLIKYDNGKKSVDIDIQTTGGSKRIDITYYNSGSGYLFNVSEIKKHYTFQKSITRKNGATANIYFNSKNDILSQDDLYIGVLNNVQDGDGNLASIIYIMNYSSFTTFCTTF